MFVKSSVLALTLFLARGGASLIGGDQEFKPITIAAQDDSIHGSFIAFGAYATSIMVDDKDGEKRDILLGYDDPLQYKNDTDYGHPYFGPVVGRYANRIRNGTFTIPITKDASGPNPYQIVNNEHNGTNSLHGGDIGYDRRPWTVLFRSKHSVTFGLFDPDGFQGFPGSVVSAVTYTMDNNATFKMSINAFATQKTPIMMSGHHYWNLEGYKETQDLDGHFAQFESANIITTDGLLIPTGELTPTEGTPLDFSVAKSIGKAIPETAEAAYCGTDCVGFDNCWIYGSGNSTTNSTTTMDSDSIMETNGSSADTVFSMWSVNSGIRMDVTTNQPALQIYTCNGIKGANPIPRKKSQGGPDQFYENHSCVVIEQESWIDAINNPEFGVNQIYGPGDLYKWEASYAFSIFDGSA